MKWLRQPLSTDFFIAAFFILLPCVKLGGEIFFGLAVVYGLAGIYFAREALPTLSSLRWLALALASFAGLKLVSAAWAINPALAVRDFFSHGHFLAFAPLLVALANSQAPLAAMLKGMRIALVVLGVWALSNWILAPETSEWGDQPFRAAAQNSGVLGDISAIYMLLNISAYLFRHRLEQIPAVSPQELWASMLCGAVAVSASGARTAFLALLFSLCVVLVISQRHKPRMFASTFAVLFTAASLMLVAQQSRFALGWEQARQWASGTSLVVGQENSVGFRLNLYETAVKAISQRPIAGYGAGNTREITSRFAPPALQQRSLGHFHNQYLQLMTETGLLGIASAAFVVISFVRAFRTHAGLLALALALIGYELVAGLTNNITKHGVLHSMLLMIFCCFSLQLLAYKRSTSQGLV